MKVWYSQRDLNHLVKMFHVAVVSGDELGATSLYGCLFDMLSTARKYADNRRYGYRWKRMVTFLENELSQINEQAIDYPVSLQVALGSKIVLYTQTRKAS